MPRNDKRSKKNISYSCPISMLVGRSLPQSLACPHCPLQAFGCHIFLCNLLSHLLDWVVFSPVVCIWKRMARINQLVGSLRSRSQGSATRRRLQHIHVSEGGRLGKKSWSLIHTNSFRTDKHSALKHGLVDTFNRRAQFEDSEILHENDCVSFYQWPLDWEGWVLRWLRSYLEPALRISSCSSTGRGLLCSASYWKGNCHAFVVFVVVCLFVHMTLCCCS